MLCQNLMSKYFGLELSTYDVIVKKQVRLQMHGDSQAAGEYMAGALTRGVSWGVCLACDHEQCFLSICMTVQRLQSQSHYIAAPIRFVA